MRREGKKAKTLGRRYPKTLFPNVPQPSVQRRSERKREDVRDILKNSFKKEKTVIMNIKEELLIKQAKEGAHCTTSACDGL